MTSKLTRDTPTLLLTSDAIDASPLAVAIRDGDGTFLRVNGPFAALVGLSGDEIHGSTLPAVFPTDVADTVRLHDSFALSAPGLVALEEWVVDRVGRRRVATSRFALRDEDDEAWGVCCVSSAAGHEHVVALECERLFSVDGGVLPSFEPDEQRPALEARVAELEQARAELAEELSAAETARADADARVAAMEARLAAAQAGADERAGTVAAALQDRLAAVEQARVAAVADADAAREQLALAEQALAEADGAAAAAADLQRRLAAARDARDAAVADADATRQRLAALTAEAAEQAAAIAAERDQAREELAVAKQALAEAGVASAAAADLQRRLAAAEEARDAAIADADAARARLAAADDVADATADLQRRLASQAAAALAATRRADDREQQWEAAVAERDAIEAELAAARAEAAAAVHADDAVAAADEHAAAAAAERDQALARLADAEQAAQVAVAVVAERDELAAALAAAREDAAAARSERADDHPSGNDAEAPLPPRDADALPAVRELAQAVASAPDFPTALRDGVGVIGARLGWDAAFIWRRERPGAPLRCVAAWTDPTADLARFQTASWQGVIRPDGGPVADAFEDGDAAWIVDVAQRTDVSRMRFAAVAGLRSAAVAAITGPDGVDGVIEVLSRAAAPEDEVRLAALAGTGVILGEVGHLLTRATQPRWSSSRR